jgi:hypothetical protein
MMKRTATALAAALVFVLLTGCGYKEGVIQDEPVSYLRFTGASQGAVVSIDDLEPFELGKADSSADTKDNPSEATGQVVVDIIIMLDNGVTREVRIP